MPRIDSYTNLTAAQLAADDELAIWDASTSTVKNVTLGNALANRFGATGEAIDTGELIYPRYTVQTNITGILSGQMALMGFTASRPRRSTRSP